MLSVQRASDDDVARLPAPVVRTIGGLNSYSGHLESESCGRVVILGTSGRPDSDGDVLDEDGPFAEQRPN